MSYTPEEIEAAKKRLAEIAKKKARYPNLFFKPNPGQYKFLESVRAGHQDGKYVYLAPWGNGTGKTSILGNIAWNAGCAKGQRNRWFEFPPFNDWKFPKRGRFICNSKQLREQTGRIWRAIHETWPQGYYTEKKQGYEYTSCYTIPETGWVWDAMTEKQDLQDHESEEIGLLVVDEPCSQEVWNLYYSRMRKGGLMMLFATLLQGGEWVEADLMSDPDVTWFFMSDHEANCSTCAKLTLPSGETLTGYLDHDTLNKIAAKYTPGELLTRTKGIPAQHHNRVFDVGDEHFVRRELAETMWRDGKLTTYLALDPHQLRPWMIVVGGIDSDGQWFMLDEWPRENYVKLDRCDRGIRDYADILKNLQTKWNITEMIIDRKFASQQMRFDTSARTLSQELLIAHGLYFAPGVVDPLVEGNGVGKLQELLAFDTSKPVDINNRPRFYIVDDLDNCRVSIRNVTKKKVEDLERHRMMEKLEPKYLDPVRCIMYLVTHNAMHSPDRAMPTQDRLDADRGIKELEQRTGLELNVSMI